MTIPIYTIYKTTNTINNKIYIGVHKTTNLNDSYLGSGDAIKLAIKKYGKLNFTKEILFEYDNPKEAYLIEFLIVNKKFISRQDTYNIKLGGQGGWISHSQKTKIKMSISGKLKIFTKQHLKNLSISRQKLLNLNLIGYFVTPWGKFKHRRNIINPPFSQSTISRWCKNPDHLITKTAYTQNEYLKSLKYNPVGLSRRDLGFWFETIV